MSVNGASAAEERAAASKDVARVKSLPRQTAIYVEVSSSESDELTSTSDDDCVEIVPQGALYKKAKPSEAVAEETTPLVTHAVESQGGVQAVVQAVAPQQGPLPGLEGGPSQAEGRGCIQCAHLLITGVLLVSCVSLLFFFVSHVLQLV